MEIVPQVMRRIRQEMRGHRMPGLSIPQFRALIFLYRNPGASLSDVADHVGLSLPSMSKTIEGLVSQKLVSRRTRRGDRRYVRLRLTQEGQSVMSRARKSTESRLREALASLSKSEQASVIKGLEALRPLFAGATPVKARKAR